MYEVSELLSTIKSERCLTLHKLLTSHFNIAPKTAYVHMWTDISAK